MDNIVVWPISVKNEELLTCNPDHNKFSSLSSTTVVPIFSKLCLWRRSLCSNLGGIGPGKLYRATLSSHVQTLTRTALSVRYKNKILSYLLDW